MKKIAVDLPYPSLDNITEDVRSASIISPAYAGLKSEITAILQYGFHHINFEEQGNDEYAETLLGIALTEMDHLDILGKTLLKLGVSPIYKTQLPNGYSFYNTSNVSQSRTPCKMLLDDIAGELGAIEEYESMLLKLDNELVSAVISRIILDEKYHVVVLKDLYSKHNCKEENIK